MNDAPAKGHNNPPITIYREVEVYVVMKGGAPEFQATVGKRRVSGGAYKTVTDKIDALIEFPPFDAIWWQYSKLHDVRITGVQRDGRDLKYTVEMTGENGERTTRVVDVNSSALLEPGQATRDAVAAYEKLREKIDEAKHALDDQVDKEHKALPRLKVRPT